MGLLDGLDSAQQEAVTTPAAPLLIVAGAGSGKTRVLTRRIAYRIKTGAATAERTLAVTFTRRAASELKFRLGRLAPEGGTEAQGVAVGTLHSLAYARLRLYWDDHRQPVPRIFDNTLRRLTAAEKQKRGVIDFDDVLVRFAETMRSDRRFAESVRWFRRHVYVDEFQDVTPAQFDAIMAWVGDGDDLCVVGDPNQSIYGWAGADPHLLAGLPRHFPHLHTIRLAANYRSSPAIVQAAARVLGTPPPAALGFGAGIAAPTLTGHRTDRDEARAIAAAVRRAHGPNTPWSHIAVLARTNGQLDPIADALHAASIPCRIAGHVGLLSRPAVRESLARLTRHAPAADEAGHLRALAHDYQDPAEQAALHEIADMAREFDALAPGASVTAFIDWLPTTRAGDGTGRRDTVQLATFHRAKGLEWPTVFVAGAGTGIVPLPNGDVDEERRLLYVAMTRAERELHISYVGAKSPFLPDDLTPAVLPPSVRPRDELAEMRRVLAEVKTFSPRRAS
jgi:DNA helicase-2/ATP-dependent DNA helicase PcrA